MLSLTQAADEVGKSKSGLLKAIKTGRLSALKDDTGQYWIDPSELFRVYAPVSESPRTIAHLSAEKNAESAHQNIEIMRELLRQVQDERDDLRRRLDDESAERRRLSQMLLTHQPAQETQKQDPTETPLYKKLFGRGKL